MAFYLEHADIVVVAIGQKRIFDGWTPKKECRGRMTSASTVLKENFTGMLKLD
jgi:5,10-methylene-tetrahydrofolate dehydrogenase/methenyl tetrahydrofolate cyclohydrolase